jgi:hypothetical protein
VEARDEGVVHAMSARYRGQRLVVVHLPEKNLVGPDELRDRAGQPAIKVGQVLAQASVHGDRQQSLDGELMGSLQPLGAANALFAEQALRLAAVELRPQIDQRIDHLLAAFVQPGNLDRGGQLIGEEREAPALHGGKTGTVDRANHSDRPAPRLQHLAEKRALDGIEVS